MSAQLRNKATLLSSAVLLLLAVATLPSAVQATTITFTGTIDALQVNGVGVSVGQSGIELLDLVTGTINYDPSATDAVPYLTIGSYVDPTLSVTIDIAGKAVYTQAGGRIVIFNSLDDRWQTSGDFGASVVGPGVLPNNSTTATFFQLLDQINPNELVPDDVLRRIDPFDFSAASGAQGNLFSVNGNIFLDSFRLNYSIDTVSVSTVPVPAALPLLLSGLIGLGAMGWRRRKVA